MNLSTATTRYDGQEEVKAAQDRIDELEGQIDELRRQQQALVDAEPQIIARVFAA